MSECKQVECWLVDNCDDTISPSRLAQLEHHLAECPECQAMALAYRGIREVYARMEAVDVNSKVAERVRALARDS